MKWLVLLAVLSSQSAIAASKIASEKAQAAVYFRIVILPPVEEGQLNAANRKIPRGQSRVETTRPNGVKLQTIVSP